MIMQHQTHDAEYVMRIPHLRNLNSPHSEPEPRMDLFFASECCDEDCSVVACMDEQCPQLMAEACQACLDDQGCDVAGCNIEYCEDTACAEGQSSMVCLCKGND